MKKCLWRWCRPRGVGSGYRRHCLVLMGFLVLVFIAYSYAHVCFHSEARGGAWSSLPLSSSTSGVAGGWRRVTRASHWESTGARVLRPPTPTGVQSSMWNVSNPEFSKPVTSLPSQPSQLPHNHSHAAQQVSGLDRNGIKIVPGLNRNGIEVVPRLNRNGIEVMPRPNRNGIEIGPGLDRNGNEVMPVLDRNGIKIMPRAPVVPEGHSLHVTCVAAQLLQRKQEEAPYLRFKFPPMAVSYEKRVSMALRQGAAVLKFRHVLREHAGEYQCVATDDQGRQTYNSITINVIENQDGDREGDSLQAPREDWLEEIEGIGDADHEEARGRDEVDFNEKLRQLRDHLHDNVDSVDLQQLIDRGRFQEKQVSLFCHKYNLSRVAGVLPTGNTTSASALYRHLLLNDKAQTMFCFAPKAGCTNLRLLFFLVLGYIPLKQFLQSRDRVDQNKLEAAQFIESFYSRNDQHRRYALNHYFKFVMYRQPLERLVSGFRSKVARYPLHGLYDSKPHFNWLRKAILLYSQPEQYRYFLHHRGKTAVNITFPDFIEYWLYQPPELKYDEHFRSISSLCQPCRTRFSFYANFKNFDIDSQLLVAKIRARPEYLRQGYYEMQDSTALLAPQLYAQLTDKQKHGVLSLLAQELDFYYHIFPEELNSHKTILGVDTDLPETMPP